MLTCGFTGALFGGLLCASSILGTRTLLNFDSWCSKVKRDVAERNKKPNVTNGIH